MEILQREDYPAYEAFVLAHPRGGFTQSVLWQQVKTEWDWAGVVSRDGAGVIRGVCGVLIRKIPLFGTSMMYAPRGPVCDIYDREVLDDLMAGVKLLAGRHRAHLFKMDTDVLSSDEDFLRIVKDMGFTRVCGPDGFEGIQARFNYRLPLAGKTPDEIMAGFHQKTRYNIRVAQKRGVEMRVRDKDALEEFMALYRVTGERDGFSIRSKNYFAKMLDALGEHARLYIGYYEGKAVCGAITVCYGGKCSYVYGASDNAHRNVMPNYLMQWEMLQWAMDSGCTLYDFQGVAGDLDNPQGHMYGLYRFKKGFGGHVEELVGELDLPLKPLVNRLVNWAIALEGRLRVLRRKLLRR